MVEYFFRSEEFIERLIKAFRFLGKYEAEGALKLAKVLRIYLISPLLDAFSEEDNPNIRKFLIYLLSNMGVDVACEAVKRLNDKRLENLISMIALIRECGGKDYIQAVKPFAKDRNKRIRTEAIKALLYFGDRDGLPYLKVSLRSKDPAIKEQAILLSGTYKVKDAVPYLIEIIKKKDILGSKSYSKIPAIRALGQIGDPQAIVPLIKLYKARRLFFSSAQNELKLEIFKTLKYYPAHAIKSLLELGMHSRDSEIQVISKRILREMHYRDSENE
jgi:hypothetical protein